MGNRPLELRDAVDSLTGQLRSGPVLIHVNGADPNPIVAEFAGSTNVRVVASQDNLGVPGGRNAGLDAIGDVDVVGFLDDDARLLDDSTNDRLIAAFANDSVAAVALRLVDEQGDTARRHVPRAGAGSVEQPGQVGTFLGGACAVRRSAFLDTGGYWAPLEYGHEELDLAWRWINRGFEINYVPDIRVFHPRTPISRHADGWRLTGRNRVLVARRNLPNPLGWLHCVVWLVLGVARAPRGCRRSYVAGWRAGWRREVERAPMSWLTVWRLSRLGRPPIV